MSEPAGLSLAAIRARQAALASQYSSVAEADRALADALASAHAAMSESASRLDAIAAEIDHAMPDRAKETAADTPMGARELQRFLVAKQREIASVVAHAHEVDHAKAAVLQGLRERYTASAE
jgi:vacuolar-type H+-ATPase subunit C/Vma6